MVIGGKTAKLTHVYCLRLMIVRYVNKVLFASALFFFSLCYSHDAFALTVSPVYIDHTMAPGESINDSIRVWSEVNATATCKIEFQRATTEGEEGLPVFIDPSQDQETANLKDWIHIKGDSSFDISTKDIRTVSFSIDVPVNAEPGGHYAVLFFDVMPGSTTGTSGVGIGSKIGVLFLINVLGDIKEGANLESFSVEHQVVDHLPVNFFTRIRSLGSVHFRPKGMITIKNIIGMETARIPLNPNNASAVLPNSIRRVHSSWIKDFNAVNNINFFVGLQNEWKNFAFGRYTAVLESSWGSKDTPFPTATVTFWVIPWRLMLVALAALIILFLLIMLYNKIIVNSAMKKLDKK